VLRAAIGAAPIAATASFASPALAGGLYLQEFMTPNMGTAAARTALVVSSTIRGKPSLVAVISWLSCSATASATACFPVGPLVQAQQLDVH
jgi:hypothetical protein